MLNTRKSFDQAVNALVKEIDEHSVDIEPNDKTYLGSATPNTPAGSKCIWNGETYINLFGFTSRLQLAYKIIDLLNDHMMKKYHIDDEQDDSLFNDGVSGYAILNYALMLYDIETGVGIDGLEGFTIKMPNGLYAFLLKA